MAMSSGLINLLRRQFPGVDDPASSANDLLKDVIIQGDQREQLEQDKKLLEEADDTGADEITREARPNPKLKRKNQILKLWNSEITAISKRNRLPVYAGKSKAFRAGALVKKLSDEKLCSEICRELFERDYVREEN